MRGPVLELLEDSGLALLTDAIIETIPERERLNRLTEMGRQYLAGESPQVKD